MHAERPNDASNVSRRRFLHRSSLALAGRRGGGQFSARAGGPRGGRGDRNQDRPDRLRRPRHRRGSRCAWAAATKVIYPTAGYHTEDVAAGASRNSKDIKVVALADLFEDRLTRCAGQLAKLGIEIPKEMCFTGFDAYQQLLAVPEINYVILATPPHFRPAHFKAAVEAGKHVFMEKPVAVDVPGVRTVIEAGELGQAKGAGRRSRHAATPSAKLSGNHQAYSRRRDRRNRLRPLLLGRQSGSGSSSAKPAGATWNGNCATGATSPGCPAITLSSNTCTTSTS